MIVPNSAVLIQHASGPYTAILKEFNKWHGQYTLRHDMDYRVYVDRPFDAHILQGRPHPSGIMWERYTYIIDALLQYDYVFYLDADAVIVDRDIDLRMALPKEAWLAMGHDGDWFQAGVQYIRGGTRTDAFYRYLCAFWSGEPNDEVAMNGAISRLQPWHWETPGLHPAWHSIMGKGHPEECVVRAFHNEGDAARRLELMRDIVERKGR